MLSIRCTLGLHKWIFRMLSGLCECQRCGRWYYVTGNDGVIPHTNPPPSPLNRRTVPLCADGSSIHDMKGQQDCPKCGYSPRLVAHVEMERQAHEEDAK